jgi:hypothetical protein
MIFPLARHRRPAPASPEPAQLSREQADAEALSSFAAAILFAPEPSDSALAGWCPGDGARAYAASELRLWAAEAEGEVA